MRQGITDRLWISLPVELEAQNLKTSLHALDVHRMKYFNIRKISYLLFFEFMLQAVESPDSWLLETAIVQFPTVRYLLLVDMDPIVKPFHNLLSGLEVHTDFADKNMLECR